MYLLKNIKKVYADDKNKETALNDISISFPNSGMVFVVGKSGSGKTTLLNLLSLFDTPTEGTIEFLGVNINSVNDDKRSFFRKNYIGFVSQEFNLFNSLSVYENVAFSLEVQGKKINKTKIESLLERLGILEYKNKKVINLSGGQKQRVAIARALIKNPKVILCDEPTGALDSTNAKEIFSILKEASKDTLVVVVTHDVEASKTYGDYLIELKDGQIVNSTLEKENDESKVSFKYFKNKKSFGTYKKSFKINIKKRPLRLACASFLMICSTGFLSFPATLLNVNKNETIIKSMLDNNETSVTVKKGQYFVDKQNDVVGTGSKGRMVERDKEFVSNELGENIDGVYCGMSDIFKNSILLKSTDSIPSAYVSYSPNGFVEVDNDLLNRYKFDLTDGRLPSNDNEIALTSYELSLYKYFGLSDSNDNRYTITSANDLIGKSIISEDQTFIVTGIIDTHINKRYTIDSIASNEKIAKEFDRLIESGMHNVIFTNKGFYKNNYSLKNKYREYIDFEDNGTLYDVSLELTKCNGKVFLQKQYINKAYNYDHYTNKLYKFDDSKDSEGVYLSYEKFYEFRFNGQFESYISNFVAQDLYDSNKELFDASEEIYNYYQYYNYLKDNDFEDNKYLHLNKDYFVNTFLKAKNKDFIKTDDDRYVELEYSKNNKIKAEVIGVYINENTEDTNNVIASKEVYNKLSYGISNYIGEYEYITIPLSSNNYKKIIKLIETKYDNKSIQTMSNETSFVKFGFNELFNEYALSYQEVESPVLFAKNISKYIFIAAIPLVSLLIFYYFSGVIYDSKKEIGIIKSLGSTNKEIVGMYLFQNIIMSLVMAAITCALISIFIPVSNIMFYSGTKPIVTVIRYSFIPYLVTIGMTIGCVLLGTLIPMINILKMKVIDIIKKG